jgi:Carboxypeptidase regulatory-like domain
VKKGKISGLAFCLLVGLSFLAPPALAQSLETGSIVGTTRDQAGGALPGVTVTITSSTHIGFRAATTNVHGEYRFPALPPGEYAVKAELQGFAQVIRKNIRLTTTVHLTVDFTLKPSDVEEETISVAPSPTVDTRSTESASVTLTSELLRNIPYSQVTSNIANLAPGVTPDNMADSAYGAQDGAGIAYLMDGVNIADPEKGTAWVFLDHNSVEEAKVTAAGLPAEYGNFTGVIFNIVTKSGGNGLSGHIELDYQGEKHDRPYDFWQQDNTEDYLADFPNFATPGQRFMDAGAHLGGPIKKDKVWFYQGLQFQRFEEFAAGYQGDPAVYDLPRSFTKITAQLNPSTSLMLALEVDAYDGKDGGASAITAPEALVNQESSEIVGHFSLTHIFSPETFVDAKAAYFWGHHNLEPKTGRDAYARFDIDQGTLLLNSGYYYLADRSRLQANVSLTHYAEDFIAGSHDFKFGVEFERSASRSQFGYTGSGGPLGDYVYYVDYWSYNQYFGHDTGNYLAYQYEGYDFNSPYTRVEGFIQDSWQVSPRININAGVRLSQNWGQVEGRGTVYESGRIAPRLGFTYDLFGDRTTIFKAHFGQFTEGMFGAYHNRLSTNWSDRISYRWNAATEDWVEYDRVKQDWKLQENIQHPYMNQYTVSLERELFRDASLSVSYIARDWKNIIGVYDILAEYEPVTYPVGPLYEMVTLYNLVSGNAHEFLIENLDTGPYRPPGKAYRKYRGLEFLFSKRFSNKWQLMLSYIYSETTGTIDNTWGDDIGWGGRNDQEASDPNFWINADGNATFDPTHMLKALGTYVLPFDISVNVYFRAITGEAWAQRFRTATKYGPNEYFGQGRITYFTEPRGSHHYDLQKIFDLRIEKVFTLAAKYRLGLMLDVFNVFNDNTITDWGTRIGYDWINDSSDPGYPSSTDGHYLYGIVNPRQVRLGIRLIF